MNLDTQIGLIAPTQAEITAGFVLAINTYIDSSFAITDSNILSQVIVVISKTLSNLFDTLKQCFSVINPTNAEGLNLVDSCLYVGVIPQTALPTKVFLLLTSETETTFPVDTTLSASGYTISNAIAAPISQYSCSQCIIQVTEAVDSQTYAFELSDIQVEYIALPGDTVDTIALALAEQVSIQAPLFKGEISVENPDSFIVNATTGGEADLSQSFPVIINEGSLSLTSFSAYAPFLNSVVGNITIPAGTFDLSNTGVSGVSSTQPQNSINGQLADTDQTLRIRRSLSLGRGGNRTLVAIRSELLKTEYVQAAQVYNNPSNNLLEITPSLDMLPHSIYCVVLGGYKTDIATAIYNKMSEGVQTNGSTEVQIVDTSNNNNVIIIDFDYAEQIPVSINATVTIDKNLLYKIGANVAETAKQAVFDNINGMNIGESMYVDDLISVIWSQIVYGIKQGGTSLSYKLLPSATSYTADLEVDANQIVVCEIQNISITVIAS